MTARIEVPTPRVSVVTPFHNTAAYLQQCIESVLNQTYGEFEYILVNNASTDGSREIALRYAQVDSRIRLIDTPQLFSQVQNYNFALSQIAPESEYTKLVQADDWIYPECLESMLEVARSDTRIGLVGSFYLQGSQVAGWGLPVTARRYAGREICRYQLFGGHFLFGSPTTVLYRSDLVRSRPAFYAEGRYHEDTDVCYELLESSDFGFVHQVLSFLRTENESIMKSASQFNPFMLDRYTALYRHGPKFLSPDELKWRKRALDREYVQFLGKSLLRCQGPPFWRYHRKGLKTVNLDLPWVRLGVFLLNDALNLVMNLKSTVERAWKFLVRHVRRPSKRSDDPTNLVHLSESPQLRD